MDDWAFSHGLSEAALSRFAEAMGEGPIVHSTPVKDFFEKKKRKK